MAIVRSGLYSEFADYTDWDKNLDVAHRLLPRLEYVFAKYTLTDDFEDGAEFEPLYDELTGAIDIIFEEDGI